MTTPAEKTLPRIGWSWEDAGLGAAYALPAAIVGLHDPTQGIALSIGVLPAAIVGLAPRRKGRLAVVALGVLTGLPMFLGGALAQAPVLAVAAIAALAIAAVAFARRSPIGGIAMVLSLPMVGVGLSYDDLGEAAGLGALMVAGSTFACLISMLWPERPDAGRSRPPAASPPLGYGVRLGAAGASAAAIGFLLDLDHVGWATAAALLVMRPVAEMQKLRSVGRIAAVVVGALSAVLLLHLDPANAVLALAILATIAGAAATHGSRWYVTPAFTTFLVLLLLLNGNPEETATRFGERTLETLLGVGLAYLFGLLLPAVLTSTRDGVHRKQ